MKKNVFFNLNHIIWNCIVTVVTPNNKQKNEATKRLILGALHWWPAAQIVKQVHVVHVVVDVCVYCFYWFNKEGGTLKVFSVLWYHSQQPKIQAPNSTPLNTTAVVTRWRTYNEIPTINPSASCLRLPVKSDRRQPKLMLTNINLIYYLK